MVYPLEAYMGVRPAYPLFMKVVASCGMAPMARNMMLRKDTPKMARDPVAVFWMPENKEPMMRDMITTWISLQSKGKSMKLRFPACKLCALLTELAKAAK